MEDRQDNQRPPAPEGLSSRATEAADAPQTQIVPYEGPVRARRAANPAMGLAWCAAGALLAPIAPPLGAYFAAIGAAMLSVSSERGRGLAVVMSALGCVSALAGATAPDVLQGVATYLVGCLVGWCVARRGTEFTREAVLTALLGASLVACDAWRMAAAGTTLEVELGAQVDAAVQLYAQQAGLSSSSVLEAARQVVMLVWPASYLVVALVSTACAHMGARTGQRRIGADSPRVPLREFDSPMWSVALLATGIVLVALGRALNGGQPLLMAGANLLVVARVVLMLDGFGVLAGLMARMGMGGIARALVLVVAANLEVSFLVVSGIGLIDFWANFRRLPRGGAQAEGQRS